MTKWTLEADGRNFLTKMNTNYMTAITTILFIFFVAPCSFCGTATYQGFKLLREADCKPMKRASLVRLPPEWQKYADFVKMCDLKETDASVPNVSVVSIWIEDYYKQLPAGALHDWENFPRPLIVDNDLSVIGELPELYPLNDTTSPLVYFGKWNTNLPTEIRIDVSNPAVEGDYYYAPLTWDENKRYYLMKTKEVTYGRRR